MADLVMSDVISMVETKLQDTSFDASNAGFVEFAVNSFISELYHNTRTRRMETNDELFGSLGDTVLDLPEDIDVWLGLTVTAGAGAPYPIGADSDRYYQYGDFMKAFPGWKTNPSKALQEWTDFGGQMRFSAPLKTDTTIDIDYCRVPTQPSTTAGTIELDAGYKELAVIGSYARCMELNEDYGEAQAERKNLAPLVTAWIRNEARGGGKAGPVVMRSNRRPGGYGRTGRQSGDW